jgi:cold shock protein
MARKRESFMACGKVKWWDRKKGYGFIIGESGKDVFVHYTTIKGTGYRSLEPGEPVFYELIQGPKGLKAENVERQVAVHA